MIPLWSIIRIYFLILGWTKIWWKACRISADIKYFLPAIDRMTSVCSGICSTISCVFLLNCVKFTHKRYSGFQPGGGFLGGFLDTTNILAAYIEGSVARSMKPASSYFLRSSST